MLKKECLEIRVTEKEQLLIKGAEKIIEKIKKLEVKYNEVVKAVEEIKKAEVKVLRKNEWQIEKELVLKEEKIYVPKDKCLRLEIIQLYHNTLIVEYGRQQKIVEWVTRNYWWLKVIKEVK